MQTSFKNIQEKIQRVFMKFDLSAKKKINKNILKKIIILSANYNLHIII